MKLVDVEVMQSASLMGKSFTVKVYVPVIGQDTMDKFYFVDPLKSKAISKAKMYMRDHNFILNII